MRRIEYKEVGDDNWKIDYYTFMHSDYADIYIETKDKKWWQKRWKFVANTYLYENVDEWEYIIESIMTDYYKKEVRRLKRENFYKYGIGVEDNVDQ